MFPIPDRDAEEVSELAGQKTLHVGQVFDTGRVVNESEVQAWYSALQQPDSYPWPSLPARFSTPPIDKLNVLG